MVDPNELAGHFASGAFSVHGVYESEIEPGSYRGHSQDNRTPYAGFVFALHGRAFFEFEGTRYELAPGKVAHGGARMTLSLDVPGPAPFKYVLIHYSADAPSNTGAGDCSKRHFVLETGENPAIVELLRRLHKAAGTPGSLHALEAKELFYRVTLETLKSAHNRANRESAGIVDIVLDYMHHHYMEPLTLQRLADIAGMDAKPFSYAFNKAVGLFPIDYVIRHRIERAKHLLVASNGPVSGIAKCVGYEDAHYFSRLFRKHTGYTPSGFRSRFGNYARAF
ncbi:AraC family transcriptional regulator [Paenibacillus flagellatus]|uniref:AraC family transcriptional regulator n=1 Tax=Paenibacillus flagellatus TaxID=2211139 RepID=A0A2V5K8D4_9BACL|nr:AraC family transcriptional regulator [Paenibacillus flagellatus]PYI54264.1 AraC family transcriptional regulator [Paenibacillus flagellatus]